MCKSDCGFVFAVLCGIASYLAEVLCTIQKLFQHKRQMQLLLTKVTFSSIHRIPLRLFLFCHDTEHSTLALPGQVFNSHRTCFVIEVNSMLSLCGPCTHMGIGGVAPHFLNRGTRWRWVFSFTSQPLYFRGMRSHYSLNRSLCKTQSRSGGFRDLQNFAMSEIPAPLNGLPTHSLLTPWPLCPPRTHPSVPLK
jgi:hypothetical protein